MEYSFRSDISGSVIAQFSMGHEVIGHWLNEEIKGDLHKIEMITRAAHALVGIEDWRQTGHEYSVIINKEEVLVKANQLDISLDDIEEGLHYYDEESTALCGLTDFLAMLTHYQQFIAEQA